MYTTIRRLGLLVLISFSFSLPLQATEERLPSPNFVPEVHLSYIDPMSGEQIACEEGCRRFEVPQGADLEISVATKNVGAVFDGHGVPWDVFFDQRRPPFPGLDVSDCQDPGGEINIECWQDLAGRVEWDLWNSVVADRVCVPEKPGECADVTFRVRMDENFEGSRGRGVYSLGVWVDRFHTNPETNEFDNYVGPIRVKVIPRAEGAGPDESAPPVDRAEEVSGLVVAPIYPKPYHFRTVQKRLEKAFNLSSANSKAVFAFLQPYAGEVVVQTDTGGRTLDKLVIQVQSFATREVLAETEGSGRLVLRGQLTQTDLKNDRRIMVVVTLAEGARPTRGSLTVTYPAEPMFRKSE